MGNPNGVILSGYARVKRPKEKRFIRTFDYGKARFTPVSGSRTWARIVTVSPEALALGSQMEESEFRPYLRG